MPNRLIGSRDFVDSTRRPICEDALGQYVLDDEGQRAYGLWLASEDEGCDPPMIVEHGSQKNGDHVNIARR